MSDFESNAQQLLRQSEAELDANVTRQLQQARQRAIESRGTLPLPSFLLPATGIATASLLALVLVYLPLNGQPEIEGDLFSTENMELYEHLEFYHWLASEEKPLKG